MGTSSLRLRLGRAHLSSRPPDYAAAQRAFRAAIRLAPEWGEPYYQLGLTYQRQGKVHEAMGAYEQAIVLNTGPLPLIALGWMRRLLGDFGAALECLHAALALNCYFAEAEARLMLAECYECAGRTEEAVGQWAKVASMSPTYPAYEQPANAARANLARFGRGNLKPACNTPGSTRPSASPPRARDPGRAHAWQVRSSI